ncbi:SRPBCC family protein [Cellulomonas edaphi]|uniref:SRPBCC family protein n=1 Tax=Cellulomonas edaphi TaxID=3053468 RepID=A0ABT7S8Q2_9CELL|nr:SRPBCC family protein [Cellulomons edaphi]MDM7832004.1 SRPBCC family protein [Cellulomons edaphi]
MTAPDAWGVLSTSPGGTSVTFERRYATSADDLWAAVTEPERIARWLGPVYGDLEVGGRYELRMGDDVPGADENATGEVLECDPPRSFAVSWLFPAELVTRVEVSVRPDGAGAILVLVHRELEVAAARGYLAGWHASLDQLEDHVADAPVRSWQDAFEAVLPHYRGEA